MRWKMISSITFLFCSELALMDVMKEFGVVNGQKWRFWDIWQVLVYFSVLNCAIFSNIDLLNRKLTFLKVMCDRASFWMRQRGRYKFVSRCKMCNLLNVWLWNVSMEKMMTDSSNFSIGDTVTSTCLNSTFRTSAWLTVAVVFLRVAVMFSIMFQ